MTGCPENGRDTVAKVAERFGPLRGRLDIMADRMGPKSGPSCDDDKNAALHNMLDEMT